MAGAPVGNENASNRARGAKWREAILRALARNTGVSVDAGLDKAADKVVKMAIERGDRWAIDHIAERVDGKVAQAVTLGGDEDNPVKVSHKVEFVGSRSAPEET